MSSRTVRVRCDGVEVAVVGPDEVTTPKRLADVLGRSPCASSVVRAIRARSADDQRVIGVDRPAELHPDEVPTLHRTNGVLAFGMALKEGGYTPNLVSVGTVEVFTRLPEEEVVRKLVVVGREPTPLDEELLEDAAPVERGAGEPTKGGGRGQGRGDGSGDGEGNGEHSGGRRMGVLLPSFARHHAKGIAVKEVVLVSNEKTIVIDAKGLDDPAVEHRLKFNNEGALRYRRYRGPMADRHVLDELRDVQRIELR
jgi:hypothetical protein